MFLQLITEHHVLRLAHFSCPLDPEGETKAKIQKEPNTPNKKKKQPDSCVLRPHITITPCCIEMCVFPFAIVGFINY